MTQKGPDCLLHIWAKPRASRNRVVLVTAERIEIQLAAPPVDGAANQVLLEFLSKTLGVSRSRLTLEKGETSRHKVVRVSGAHASELSEILDGMQSQA